MNRAIILILGLMLVFSFGCIEETPVEPVVEEPEEILPPDCGTDFDCFILASEDCTPANMMYTQSVEIFGMVNTVENYMEIQGEEDGECLYYQITESSVVELSEDLREMLLEAGKTEEEIDAVEADATENAQLAVGTEINCTMEAYKLNLMLNNWKVGTFSSNDLGGSNCILTVSPALEAANERLEQEREEAERESGTCAPVVLSGEAEIEIAVYPEDTIDFRYGEEIDLYVLGIGETASLPNRISMLFEDVIIDAECEKCGEKPVWTESQQAKLVISSMYAADKVIYVDQGEHGTYASSYVCKTIGFEQDCVEYISDEIQQYYLWEIDANKSCE